MAADRVLVVGGRGEVGRRVALDLDRAAPGSVLVGGRTGESIEGLAGRAVDVDDFASVERALDGVALVLACVRQREPHLLRAVVRRGLAYTSIAPPWLPWDQLAPLHEEARTTGARVVYATGLEPGISSVLARVGAERLGGADAVETALILGVGDAYGPDSLAFLLDELAQDYQVQVDGRSESARAFRGSVDVAFPEPFGVRKVHPMPFRDQLYYPRTLGARTAVARLALDPPWVDRLVTTLVRMGRPALRGGGSRGALHGLAERLRARHADHDRYALVVEVRRGDRIVRSTLVGRGQADATAIGSIGVARALLDGAVEPGVWLAEQVVPTGPFLARLAERGLVVTTA